MEPKGKRYRGDNIIELLKEQLWLLSIRKEEM